ncbi:MAG: dihydrofolate reductase family protein [Fimbriimonadaceae bacterium]|nr:dihydrofolate reductase family protein [Chthonomonadaceae bacterium]MCO5298186.1 dihydrofolate reductase family protein [Fimbriimonadaceae bacterium]
MPSAIPVAHDFNCPWCWIGLFHARRLQQEFGVAIDWRPYELYPDTRPWPEPIAVPPVSGTRPPTPGRLTLAYAAEGMAAPAVARPKRMRTHAAHEAVEYAKTEGVADALVERFYRGYWERGLDLAQPSVLANLAQGTVKDVGKMLDAVRDRSFAPNIVGFDDDAYASGVFHVPTFWIGERRLAEQPYVAIRSAMEEAGYSPRATGAPYAVVHFDKAPSDRPRVVMMMVATIDGKTTTGTRDEPVMDLGSEVDHAAMRQVESAVDAVMIGANTLRSTPKLWYDARLQRIVVTRSGRVDFAARFFTDAPSRAVIATPVSAALLAPADVGLWRGGDEGVDFEALLRWLHVERGVNTLLVEGGSDLNAALLTLDLVDELFLTIAPKIKLGAETPTIADGAPLARDQVRRFELAEHHRVGDELFVRYRRVKGS